MKLTVGPLPSAVYWRRRGGVLGALLVVAVAGLYSCSGTSNAAKTTSGSPSATSTGSKLLAPVAESPSPTAVASSASPAAPALTGPCADTEISLAATPDQATIGPGAPVKIFLKIKNTSNRTCERDVGPDPQEVYIQRDGAKLWSSDSCGAPHGTDVRPLAPGQEVQFFAVWNGTARSSDCASTTAAFSGSYQVFGRLGTKLSVPAPLAISGGS
jgi:hypothetical protein